MKQAFLIVFEFDPRTAVRNYLCEIFVAVALEENARAAMELRYDDALGTVDDERSVIGHQRDLAEEHVLFLDVANCRNAGFRVLVEDRQTDLDLQRNAVRHAPLLTFLLVVFVFKAYRLTAVVAEVRPDGVERSAAVAEHIGRIERIDLDLRTAVLTICPKVFEALEVAAFTLPVPDLVFDVFKRCRLAKIRDRKYRLEYRLESDMIAFFGDQVHLKKAVV